MMASGDNGFGRRRPAQNGAPVPAGGGPAMPPGPSRFNLAGPVRAILTGVAVIGLFAGTYFAAMKGFGKALDRHWQENVGYPGLEDAHKRSTGGDPTLEAAHNDCKSRSDFIQLGPAETRALEGFDGLYSGENALAKAAFYVSCLTRQNPPRFCQAAHRAHLVAAVNDYYKLMAKVREERRMVMSAPFALERSMLINPGGSRAQAGTAPSAQSDPRVVDGLRALIVNGYLTRRDLGGLLGSLPGNLDTELRGVEARLESCA